MNEIAGVKKGKPMTFDEADTGKVNPNFWLGLTRRRVLYDPQSDEKLSGKKFELLLYTIRTKTVKLLNISTCFLNKAVVDFVLEERK